MKLEQLLERLLADQNTESEFNHNKEQIRDLIDSDDRLSDAAKVPLRTILDGNYTNQAKDSAPKRMLGSLNCSLKHGTLPTHQRNLKPANPIRQHQDDLEKRHYVRTSRQSNYWCAVFDGRWSGYRESHGDDFYLIIAGAETGNDFFCIPADALRDIFTESHLSDPVRRRWMVTIRNQELIVQHCEPRLDLHAYYATDVRRWLAGIVATEDTGEHGESGPSSGSFTEGRAQLITISRFERNPAARAACIDHHGYACAVCHFDFEKFYGPVGKGFIHIHHLHPLAHREGEHEVDPVRDLIPLCANCHAMAHSRPKPFAPDELREMIASVPTSDTEIPKLYTASHYNASRIHI